MNDREILRDEFDVLGQLGPEVEIGVADLGLLRRGLIKKSELIRNPFPWSIRIRAINDALGPAREDELED